MSKRLRLEDSVDKINTNAKSHEVTSGDDSEFALHMRKLGRVESLKYFLEEAIKDVSSNGFLSKNMIISTADKINGYRIALGNKISEPTYKDEFMKPILMMSIYDDNHGIYMSLNHQLNSGNSLIQNFDISTDTQYLRTKNSIKNYLKHGCGKNIFKECEDRHTN